jgi:hypothetical protein
MSSLSSSAPSDAEEDYDVDQPEIQGSAPIEVSPAAVTSGTHHAAVRAATGDGVTVQSAAHPPGVEDVPTPSTAEARALVFLQGAPLPVVETSAPAAISAEHPASAAASLDIEMGPPTALPPLILIPPTPVNSQEDAVIGPVPLPVSPPAVPPPGQASSSLSFTTPAPISDAAATTVAQVGDPPQDPSSSRPQPASGATSPAAASNTRTPRARTPAGSQRPGSQRPGESLAVSDGCGPVTRSRSRSRSPIPVAGEKRPAEDDGAQATKKTRVYVELPPHTQ